LFCFWYYKQCCYKHNVMEHRTLYLCSGPHSHKLILNIDLGIKLLVTGSEYLQHYKIIPKQLMNL
jgi:hypothetical protein